MKKLYLLTLLIFSSLILVNCEIEEDEPEFFEPKYTSDVVVNSSSIIPSTTAGRTNVKQGCIETDSRIITVSLWDHGTIDGDIVSFYINGKRVVAELTLDGPSNKYTFDITLSNNGFNYVTLFAHNLGDVEPNTAAISINGEQFTLRSNLDTNGAFDVVVTGYNVSCSDSGNTGGSNTSGGSTDTSNGSIAFYTTSDLGCGNITITVDGNNTQTLSQYFPQGIANCSQGTIFNLSPGTHTYRASCNNYTWEDTFTIVANGCLRYRLQ